MKNISTFLFCIALSLSGKAQLLESYTIENWTDEEWQYVSRDLYFYDDNGNQNQYEFNQYDNSTSSWNPYFRDTIYFDSNGRRDSVITNLYDANTMQWAAFSKGIYEYSPEGYFLSYLVENYVGEETLPSSLTTYEYDENGFQIQNIYSVWDAETDSWRGLSKSDITPNSEGLVDTIVSYLFFADLQDWGEFQRTGHTYSTSGKVLETVTEDFTSGDWIKSSRDSFEYDASDYLIERKREAWDIDAGLWINSLKTEYTNTSFGKMEQTLTTYWDASSSTWLNSQRGNYVYSEPSGLKDKQMEEATLFPNPAEGSIKILKANNTQITILNSTGSMVDKILAYEGETINIDTYNPGVYIVIVNNGKDLKTSRFIKK